MTMRRTPFQRIRYPWASDAVNVADVQSMGADIDQALVNTANLATSFSKLSSVIVQRQGAGQSITKATLTAITFDTVIQNNGVDSPLANGSWYSSANPTRLTAPTACIVVAQGMVGVNFSTALGATNCWQVTIGKNGSVSAPNVQGSKFSPTSTFTGQHWTSAISMWRMAVGDYLELKVYWTGTPAGPFTTDPNVYPTFSLSQVALPTVP